MDSKDKSSSKTANATSAQCLENGGSAACWAWGYEMKNGPLKWGRYFPDCRKSAQSPILLESCQIETYPNAGNKLQFNWEKLQLPKVTVNRTSTSLMSVFNGNTGANTGETIFEETRYRVMKIQFHASSEHEVDDMKFPLELEVFHRKLGRNGALLPDELVLSILYEFGAASPFLSSVGFDANCSDASAKSCIPAPLRSSMVSGDLNLSAALPVNDGYYHYTGSLSTPPCTEGVLRVVMKSRATLSPKQMETFPFKDNFRPVQSIGERAVHFLSSGSDAQALDFAYQTTWSAACAVLPNHPLLFVIAALVVVRGARAAI